MNEDARRLARQARDLAGRVPPELDLRAEPRDLPAGDAPVARSAQLPPTSRVGLVLAGGGAKGAFQVGVVDALADLGFPVAAIGGASIGALNGAVLACAPNLRSGADALIQMWREVASIVAEAGPAAPPASWRESMPVIDQFSLLVQQVASPVLRPEFISSLITRHVDPVRLASGPQLWVTATASTDLDLVTRKFGWLLDMVRARAERQAEWFCVGELPAEEIVPALLASAALPLVFRPRQVGSVRYRDGGLMDNVPVAPLVANCRCELIVVVHLSASNEFDAKRFQGVDILEIRPRQPLEPRGPLGGFNALLDFSPARVNELISQGRRDAGEIIKLLRASLTSIQDLRHSSRSMLEALSDLES